MVEDFGFCNGIEVNGCVIIGLIWVCVGDILCVFGSYICFVDEVEVKIVELSIESDFFFIIFCFVVEFICEVEIDMSQVGVGIEEFCCYVDCLWLFNDIYEVFGCLMEIDDFFYLIFERVFEYLQFENGMIFLCEGDGF